MRLQTLFILAAIVTPLWASAAQAANPDHLAQLLNTKECPACDLSGADLVGADLTNAKLEGANLNSANLTGADLSGARLTRASLAGASAVGANFQRATLNETVFAYANLAFAQLNNSQLNKTDFQAANLIGADFSGARVTKSTFVAANLINLKNSQSLYISSNGNIFRGELKFIQGEVRTSSLDRSATTIEKAVPDVSPTFESGGSPAPSVRIFRRYRIPAWMGRPLRSSTGATYLHRPNDHDLVINIW